MPPSVACLPIEILYHILEELETRDLRNAALVSTAFNTAATPSLYHTIVLRPDITPATRIHRLLRTLMSRSQIGERIKGLVIAYEVHYINDFVYTPETPPALPAPGGLFEISQAENIIRHTGLEIQDMWIDRINREDTQGILALLLTLLPNLASLDIHPSYFSAAPFFSRAILEAIKLYKIHDDSLIMFQSLTKVSLRRGSYSRQCPRPDEGFASPAASAFSFFYLPGLKEISLLVDRDDEELYGSGNWSCGLPDPSTLEVLEVNGNKEDGLATILPTCSKLRKLTWAVELNGFTEGLESRVAAVDRDAIIVTLAAMPKTLNDLTLSTLAIRPCGYTDSEIQPNGSLRGLREFSNIRTLTVSWLLLMGQDRSTPWGLPDVLPRSLEHLIIEECRHCHAHLDRDFKMNGFNTYSAIQNWLRNWQSVTPCLKSFTIDLGALEGFGSCVFWTLDIRNKLMELCESVGVEHHQDDYEESEGSITW